jgi:hypothetical protein
MKELREVDQVTLRCSADRKKGTRRLSRASKLVRGHGNSEQIQIELVVRPVEERLPRPLPRWVT